MASETNHINIQFGRTDGFRYIGIQPPLTDEQIAKLRVASQEGAIPINWGLREPYKGEPHSEVGYMSHIGEERLLHVAELIAGILTDEVTAVHINKTLHDIGYGRFLFGGEAERLG